MTKTGLGGCRGDLGQHCWHPTGVRYLVKPPLTEYICCHCGMKKKEPESTPATEGHGSYLPK